MATDYLSKRVGSCPMVRISRTAIGADRKSTRLNSSHSQISYAVFCLKKKKTNNIIPRVCHPLVKLYPSFPLLFCPSLFCRNLSFLNPAPTYTSNLRVIYLLLIQLHDY